MKAVYGSFPRIRVRMSGWIFGLILFLGLLAALNTGFNLLYIVVSGLFSFVVLSGIFSFWTLFKISLRRDAPYAVNKKQPFLVSTTIVNPKWLMPAISLRIERQDKRGVSSGYILKLGRQSAARLNIREVMEKRGEYKLPPYVLMTSFPFGLFEMRRQFRDHADIIVYPRISPVRTSVVEHMPGARYTPRTPKEAGDEFFSLREYQLGDDVRHISWRASARLGKWMIRELAQGSSRDIVIVLDTRRVKDLPDFDEKLEEVVDLAASLGASLLNRQYQVGIICPDAELKMSAGTSQQKHILELLARVKAIEPEACPDFDNATSNLDHLCATVLYISVDPRLWGMRRGVGDIRTLDPREVIHA